MIFEIPICDKLSDYIPMYDEEDSLELFSKPFSFFESKKFNVTYDDYDSPLHKEGHYPEYKQKTYICSQSTSNDYSFHRHLVTMKLNAYNDVINFVEMNFYNPNATTYKVISEILEKCCGKPDMEIVTKGNSGNFFSEEKNNFVSEWDYLTERYYTYENIVIQLNRIKPPTDNHPIVTLKAFTQLGYYSKEKFEEGYKVMDDKYNDYLDSLPQYHDNHPDNKEFS